MFLFLFILFTQSATAAPCCAGSSALPSIITGDEARFIGLSVSNGEVVADVAGAGKGLPVFRDSQSNQEIRRNISINLATLISDRWQVGASVPVVQNVIASGSLPEKNTQLGDVSASVGFEALPEWEYSEWKPRVFTFIQWVAPTGKSISDSQTVLASDVSGLGFHQLHLGAVAIKRWSNWDTNLVLKLGKELSHSSSLMDSSFGLGYSFGDVWRVGMSLEAQYQSPMKVEDTYTSQKLVWNTGATVTLLVGSNSSVIAGYSDQTLFGPAINTTLARTFNLAFQQRFER